MHLLRVPVSIQGEIVGVAWSVGGGAGGGIAVAFFLPPSFWARVCTTT